MSGAINASTKKGRIIKRVKRGAHRGNGLTRIHDNCKALSISLTVLSQSGTFLINRKGETHKPINRPKRIFAGTLYHMVIETKKKTEGKYDHTNG